MVNAAGETSVAKPDEGRKRVVIEHVKPEIDAGRFPAKRVEGDVVSVEADVFGDGHDHVEARLLHRAAGEKGWTAVPMEPLGNDRFRGQFHVGGPGRYEYTLAASIDHIDTWQDGLTKKLRAGQDVGLELQTGSLLVEEASLRARGEDARELRKAARLLRKNGDTLAALEKTGQAGAERTALAAPGLAPELVEQARRSPEAELETRYERVLGVEVDRQKARFSTWYELFPRSQGPDVDTHGTFRDVEAKLPYLQALGFDVLYFPPIHPIGREYRKGKNNAVAAGPGDWGSCWAVGAKEGGHTAILSELGTFEDFDRLRRAAEEHGLEIALDIAFQCAPDHPWVQEHPSWFKHRADGSIQYAENPPKK